MTVEAASGATRPLSSRAVWIACGTLGLVSLAAAGTIAIRSALPATEEPVHPVAAATSSRAPVKAAERHAAVVAKCAECGVVESVRSVTRKGQATGVGAVAGGVVGAALGNQVGKGNGRTAMTVLGAVGGGVAGHEVEKRARSHTVHEVRVRMDDGSLRTIELAQPTAHAGERVLVQGSTLKPVPAAKG